MTPADFAYFRTLLKERSGLVLSEDKRYLLESRLLPIARKLDVADLSGLVQRMRRPGSEALIIDVVEAMTTNETYFFRDKVPFEHFRNVMMPALLAARADERRLRIWCAACSTGQEPYSLAMSLKEMGPRLARWRIEIVASDLSGPVLERAESGLYSQFEVQRGLPIQMLVKYFSQAGDQWQIAQSVRDMVRFRPLNLLRDFAALGAFDVIFCRNVLIYFDVPTKRALLGRLARALRPDGFLVLGAAETVVGLSDGLAPHPQSRGLYVPAARAWPSLVAATPA